MKGYKRVIRTVLMVSVFGLLGTQAAANVKFTAVDLPDITPGQDLWSYEYQISGSFDAFSGLELLFDSGLYSDLGDLTSNPDWISFITQPDPILPAPGVDSLTALISGPDLFGPFGVSFVWLGGDAVPGSQPFNVFDANFNLVSSGRTQQVGRVPEPWTLSLLLGAVAAAGVARTGCKRSA